jgi:hypothetical protein
MRIRFQPRRGTPVMELRDIIGGNKLARWQAGDERDIPAGAMVLWQPGSEAPSQVDAVTAIFRHGPDFVDAATGKNPLFVCAICGEDALEEHAFDYAGDKPIPFVDDAGKRLDAGCFLGTHPDLIPYFKHHLEYGRKRKDVITKAEKIAAGYASAGAPVKADRPAAADAEVK